MAERKKIFFENLDGFRFLAFLSVFLAHSFHTDDFAILHSNTYGLVTNRLLGNATYGINLFFVLSGFLITYLLIDEKLKSGKIHIIKFWIRRIFRIWPLFYFAVAFGFFIFPIIKTYFGEVPEESANIIYYLTFTNNFDFINSGLPDASILGVLWSVAIEEQFYLAWPLILFLFPVKYYWIPFSVIISGAIVFRAMNDNGLIHEYHTLSCIGDMATGAFGAWLIRKQRVLDFFKNVKIEWILILYGLFIIVFFYKKEIFYWNSFMRVIERPVVAVLIIGILLEQCYSKNSFYKMGKIKLISKLGIITYGLYILHFLGILITLVIMRRLGYDTNLWLVIFLSTALSLAISIGLAKLSYRYLEAPFFKLKEKFGYVKFERKVSAKDTS